MWGAFALYFLYFSRVFFSSLFLFFFGGGGNKNLFCVIKKEMLSSPFWGYFRVGFISCSVGAKMSDT